MRQIGCEPHGGGNVRLAVWRRDMKSGTRSTSSRALTLGCSLWVQSCSPARCLPTWQRRWRSSSPEAFSEHSPYQGAVLHHDGMFGS